MSKKSKLLTSQGMTTIVNRINNKKRASGATAVRAIYLRPKGKTEEDFLISQDKINNITHKIPSERRRHHRRSQLNHIPTNKPTHKSLQ